MARLSLPTIGLKEVGLYGFLALLLGNVIFMIKKGALLLLIVDAVAVIVLFGIFWTSYVVRVAEEEEQPHH